MNVNLSWEISSSMVDWEQAVGVAVSKFTDVPLAIFGRRFLPDRSGSGDR
jgi:hypothetical protein